MKNGQNLKASFLNKKCMNTELRPAIPIIEICGNTRVLVENHSGIVGYCDNEIRIKAQYGCICVYGNHLKLSRMSKTKLVITGRFLGLELQGRDDRDVV